VITCNKAKIAFCLHPQTFQYNLDLISFSNHATTLIALFVLAWRQGKAAATLEEVPLLLEVFEEFRGISLLV